MTDQLWPEIHLPRPTDKQLGRFWSQVNATPGCWLWTGQLQPKQHYGLFGYRVDGRKRKYRAHRLSYLLLVGAIPDGLVLDHLCRVRHCVNPSHLEPVTMAENTHRGEGLWGINHRKTECINGHPFDAINTYWRKDRLGRRQCRACDRDNLNERRRRARAERLAV